MASIHKKRQMNTRLLVILLVVCACTATFAAVQLATGLAPYNEAGQEYDALRENYAPIVAGEPAATGGGEPAQATPAVAEQAKGPAEINPDFIGWLEIAGTDISYPVVQGEDNNKYLTTTFSGEENKLGAIFMDVRCTGGFESPYTILYGHNAKDGSMFGSLSRYLDADYRREHPAIEITTAEGETLTYHILTAVVTDIYDVAYRLPEADADALAVFAKSIGAPDDATGLLTLSTCTDTGVRDKRLLVCAVLEETMEGKE